MVSYVCSTSMTMMMLNHFVESHGAPVASPFEPRQSGHYALDPTLVGKEGGRAGGARVHALGDLVEKVGLSLVLSDSHVHASFLRL